MHLIVYNICNIVYQINRKRYAMIDNVNEKVLDYIVEDNELNIEYQPIVSVRNRQIVGVEALTRSYYNGEYINPQSLFDFAKHHRKGKKLDIMCRNKSLEGAAELCRFSLLFLNFEAQYLDFYINRFSIIKNKLKSLGIAHNHIVIEINEECTRDCVLLLKFINLLRNEGFLIALDDVGAGHSNLNRLIETKPDIIKIDKKAITDINNNYFKKETTKSLVSLAKKIGAVTVAEGVETLDEAVACMKLGIDFYQGFYFSKSQKMENLKNIEYSFKFSDIATTFKASADAELSLRKAHLEHIKEGFSRIIAKLSYADESDFDEIITEAINNSKLAESIYIIDINGCQVTDTIMSEAVKNSCNPLFSPSKKNDMHNMKPYFFTSVIFDSEIFMSEVYISIATGNYCQTNSVLFNHSNGKKYVLCVNYKVQK